MNIVIDHLDLLFTDLIKGRRTGELAVIKEESKTLEMKEVTNTKEDTVMGEDTTTPGKTAPTPHTSFCRCEHPNNLNPPFA